MESARGRCLRQRAGIGCGERGRSGCCSFRRATKSGYVAGHRLISHCRRRDVALAPVSICRV